MYALDGLKYIAERLRLLGLGQVFLLLCIGIGSDEEVFVYSVTHHDLEGHLG